MGITCTKTAGMRIGEQLPCTREPGTRKDPFAVAVVSSSVSVSQLRVCMSACTTGLIACSGGRIRLGVANQNPQSAKIISAKFCKRTIRKNFVPRKFGAIMVANRLLHTAPYP